MSKLRQQGEDSRQTSILDQEKELLDKKGNLIPKQVAKLMGLIEEQKGILGKYEKRFTITAPTQLDLRIGAQVRKTVFESRLLRLIHEQQNLLTSQESLLNDKSKTDEVKKEELNTLIQQKKELLDKYSEEIKRDREQEKQLKIYAQKYGYLEALCQFFQRTIEELEEKTPRDVAGDRRLKKVDAKLGLAQQQKSKLDRSIEDKKSIMEEEIDPELQGAIKALEENGLRLKAELDELYETRKQVGEKITNLQSEITAIRSSQIKSQIVLRQLAQTQPEAMLSYAGANLNSREIDMCLAFASSFSNAFRIPKEQLIAGFVKSQTLLGAVQDAFFAPGDPIMKIFESIYESILKEAGADYAKARPLISRGVTEALRLLYPLRDNLKFFGVQGGDPAFSYLLKHDNKHFMNLDLLMAETGWSDIGENPDLPLAGSDHGSIGYVHEDGSPVKESEQEKVSAAAIRAIVEDQIEAGGFEFSPNPENPFSFQLVPRSTEGHGSGFADLKLRTSLNVEGEEYKLDNALWLPLEAGEKIEPGKTQVSKDKIQEVPLERVNELFFLMNFEFDRGSNKWKIGGSIYPVIPNPTAISAE